MDKENVVYTCACTHAHAHTLTREYFPAMKKNKIMSFEATWMDLDIIVLSGVSPKKTITTWYHLYVESKI